MMINGCLIYIFEMCGANALDHGINFSDTPPRPLNFMVRNTGASSGVFGSVTIF